MKKALLFLSVIFLALQSCSTESTDSSTSDSVLLKKTISSSGEVYNFQYNGSKIVKISSPDDSEYLSFSYTGDLITKQEWFDGNNESMERLEFSYTSNKLTGLKDYSPNNTLESISTFIYNSDGSVTETENDYAGGNVIQDTYIYKYYFDMVGNLIKEESYSDNNSLSSTTNYYYDNKNSMYLNVTGSQFLWYPIFLNFARNNVIKETTIYPGSSQVYTDMVASYQYNNQNYPISGTITYDGQTTSGTYIY